VGELVINKIRLASLAESLGDKPLEEAVTQMGRLSEELQHELMTVLHDANKHN